MNLYLLTQTYTIGYDTFNAIIVAAPSFRVAKQIHPYDTGVRSSMNNWVSGTWANHPRLVTARLIGRARSGTKKGVILSSFNAG